MLQKYGYNIPANMYAAAALRRLLVLNEATWGSAEVKKRASKLLQDITTGLEQWGTTQAPDGSTVYAYEVRSVTRAECKRVDNRAKQVYATPQECHEACCMLHLDVRCTCVCNACTIQGRPMLVDDQQH